MTAIFEKHMWHIFLFLRYPPKNILITTYIHIKVLRMFALIIFSYLDQQYVFNDQVYLSKTDKIKGQLSNIAKLNYN